MLWPSRFSLRIKLPLTITAVVAGVAFTIGAAIIIQQHARFQNALEDRALLIARSVAATTSDLVLSHDYWLLYKTLTLIAQRATSEVPDQTILAGMVLDREGRVLADLEPRKHPLGVRLATPNPDETSLLALALAAEEPRVLAGGSGTAAFVEGIVPLRQGGTRVGVVRLRLSTAEIAAQTRSMAATVLGLTLVLVVAGSVAGALASNRMVRPLHALAKGMEKVGRGEFDQVATVAPVDQDEIGVLASRFNRMAEELTEKRRLEQAMAVGEKLVALGRIAAGVAHEINNPLAGMLNSLDNLKLRRDDPDLLQRYLDLSEKGLHRIGAIVQSLLVELQAEGSDVWGGGLCLDDLRDLVVSEIGNRPISLEWDNRLRDDACLNCRRVQQIALNLLRNAVQAVSEHGQVTFRAYLDGEHAVIEIDDDGVGISAENMGRIFDPFFTSRANGTGLGLWITFRLVESLGGRIDVESAPGEGSSFRVVMPTRPLDLSGIAHEAA